MKMQKERTLTSEIIDLVEDAIRKAHPKVDKIGKNCQGNTLLYGEKYYNLEDSLAEILKEAYLLKDKDSYKKQEFNPSKRITSPCG